MRRIDEEVAEAPPHHLGALVAEEVADRRVHPREHAVETVHADEAEAVLEEIPILGLEPAGLGLVHDEIPPSGVELPNPFLSITPHECAPRSFETMPRSLQ